MGETRNAYRILERKPLGKHPLVCLRKRWEENLNPLAVPSVFST